MDYDFRNPANSAYPMYGPPASTSSGSSAPSHHPTYGSSLYPRIGQQDGHSVVPPVSRTSSSNQSHSLSSSSSGLGIRVSLKPEYRITSPPTLSPQVGDVRRSNFHFDFDFERRVLAEAKKDNQNWSRLGMENVPSKNELISSVASVSDSVVDRYIASGLNREAVHIAVANYGDNPTKVREFTNGYTILREMGYSSNNAAEVLLMYDNDTDKALAHLLDSSA